MAAAGAIDDPEGDPLCSLSSVAKSLHRLSLADLLEPLEAPDEPQIRLERRRRAAHDRAAVKGPPGQTPPSFFSGEYRVRSGLWGSQTQSQDANW